MMTLHFSTAKRFMIIAAVLLLCLADLSFAQARKPIIMVVPSDAWCNENGFLMEFENQGIVERVPDYQRALQQSPDLLMVISTINGLMAERGYPLKDLESSLKSLKLQRTEDQLREAELAESPVDALKRVAQADIWMQVTWTINKTGPKQSVSFILRGLDAYTNKQIAGANGTGEQSFSVELPVLLEEAVIAHLDGFNEQLKDHFDDMFENGREVGLRVRVWDTADVDLDEYVGDKFLNEIIEDWMYENAKNGRFSTTVATQNQMVFEQVRIPMYDERDRAIDTRIWARDLQRYLRSEYQIKTKLTMKGLGQAQLILGEI